MILSNKGILKHIRMEDIRIEPFNKSNLGPNSYDITLHNELLIYTDAIIDCKKDNPTVSINIPETGLLLQPNKLYLGRTVEHTTTNNLVPMIEGRSSIGRDGIFIHATAGFGDNGFCGHWTLEISVVQPVIIYPYIRIGQLFWHTIDDRTGKKYQGKYQNNKEIQSSKLYKDLL